MNQEDYQRWRLWQYQQQLQQQRLYGVLPHPVPHQPNRPNPQKSLMKRIRGPSPFKGDLLLALTIIITAGFLIGVFAPDLFGITGFAVSGPSEKQWEHLEVIESNEEIVKYKVKFDQYRPEECSDGVAVYDVFYNLLEFNTSKEKYDKETDLCKSVEINFANPSYISVLPNNDTQSENNTIIEPINETVIPNNTTEPVNETISPENDTLIIEPENETLPSNETEQSPSTNETAQQNDTAEQPANQTAPLNETSTLPANETVEQVNATSNETVQGLAEVTGNAVVGLQGKKDKKEKTQFYIYYGYIESNQTSPTNETSLNETVMERLEETIQLPAEVGKKVKWKKKIILPNDTLNLSVEIPDVANLILVEETENNTRKNILNKTLINGATVPAIASISEATITATVANKTVLIEEPVMNVTIEYETPAPNKTEEKISHGKRVKVSSKLRYKNVSTYAVLDEEVQEQFIKLYWIKNGLKVDVTSDPDINLQKIDTNNNSLVDYLNWTIPSALNETFEVSITIINVHSYPTVGGNWTVLFNTTGTADLTITAFNGTIWVDSNPTTEDLEFLEVSCGDSILSYKWIDNGPKNRSVFIPNYTCNETGRKVSKVLTSGAHNLMFNFGGQKAYAYNFASNESVLAQIYQTNVLQDADTEISIQFNQETVVGSAFSHDTVTNNERLNFNEAGWYKVSYGCVFDEKATSGQRQEQTAWLEDSLGTEIIPSRTYTYLRDEQSGYGDRASVSAVTLVNMAAGDYLTLQTTSTYGARNVDPDDSCWMYAEKLHRPAAMVRETTNYDTLIEPSVHFNQDFGATVYENTTVFTVDLTNNRIAVDESGWYKIYFVAGSEQTSGTSNNDRIIPSSYIYKNNTAEIEPSMTYSYHKRSDQAAFSSEEGYTIAYLNAGENVSLRRYAYKRQQTTALTYTLDDTWLMMEKLPSNDILLIWDTTGGQAITSTTGGVEAVANVTWDSQVQVGANYTHTIGSHEFTIEDDGWFEISYAVSFEAPTGTNRKVSCARLYKNGVLIEPSNICEYERDTGSIYENSVTANFIVNNTKGDTYWLEQAVTPQQNNGGHQLIADGSWISVIPVAEDAVAAPPAGNLLSTAASLTSGSIDATGTTELVGNCTTTGGPVADVNIFIQNSSDQAIWSNTPLNGVGHDVYTNETFYNFGSVDGTSANRVMLVTANTAGTQFFRTQCNGTNSVPPTVELTPPLQLDINELLIADGNYTISPQIYTGQQLDYFDANCTAKGGNIDDVWITLQNSSSAGGPWSNTPEVGGDINVLAPGAVNIGPLTKDTAGTNQFSIVGNTPGTYWFRVACTDAGPTTATEGDSNPEAMDVLSPLLTDVNASFTESSILVNSDTVFSGNCTSTGTANGVNLIIQNGSGSTWTNTPTTVSDVYTNVSSYLVGGDGVLADTTSATYNFNITATASGSYNFRLQCNSTDASPSSLNTTAHSLTVNSNPVIIADGNFTTDPPIYEYRSIDFQANCSCTDADCNGVDLVLRNSSTGSDPWSNTPTAVGDIYSNATLYNAGTITSGSAYNAIFNITATKDGTYYFKAYCNSTNAVPSESNGTAEALLVNNPDITSADASFTDTSILVSTQYTELYGNCTAGGDATGVTINIQNGSGDSWSNTPTTVSDIYSNISSYSIGSLADATSSDYSFNITATTSGSFSFKLKCSSTNAGEENSTTQTLTVNPRLTGAEASLTSSTITVDTDYTELYGNCTADGSATGVNIIAQNSSTGSDPWSITPITVSDIYANISSYLIGSVADETSSDYSFNITATAVGTYYTRLQCNSTDATPANYNSTAQTLTVQGPPTLTADGNFTTAPPIYEYRSIDFQANCSCSGQDCTGVDLVLQNSSTGSDPWSNTPTAVGDIYSNATLYNAGTITSGSAYNAIFNITATKDGTYYFKSYCNSTNADSVNGTAEALLVNDPSISSASSFSGSQNILEDEDTTTFYGNCTISGLAEGVIIYLQNSTDDLTYSNTPTSGGDGSGVSVDTASYSEGDLEDTTSGDRIFTITAYDSGTYYFRTQCTATNTPSTGDSIGSALTVRDKCGQTFTSDTTLTYNITGCSVNKIVNITAANVKFDCAGYQIQGSGDYGIYVDSVNGVNVTNCIINLNGADGDYGINYQSAGFGYIINNTIYVSDDFGIRVFSGDNNTIINNSIDASISANGQYGIRISGSENTTVRGNNVTADDDAINLFNTGTINTKIFNNNFTATTANAISLDTADNNNIYNNKIYTAVDTGIDLIGSNNNNISLNNITALNDNGVYVRSSSASNFIHNNEISVGNNYGIWITGSLNNLVFNNIIDVAYLEGIFVTGKSNNTLVYNNTVSASDGLHVSSYTFNTSWYDNVVSGSTNGIRIQSNAEENSFYNNNITVSGENAVYILSAVAPVYNNVLFNNNLSSGSAPLILDSTTIGSNNTLKYNTSFGELEWLRYGNLTVEEYGSFLIGRDINITSNNIYFDSASWTSLNRSANLTFYNVGGIAGPIPLRSGTLCPSSICSDVDSLGGNSYRYNVTSFTNYGVGDSGGLVADGNFTTAPPIYIGYSIDFQANCTCSGSTCYGVDLVLQNASGAGGPWSDIPVDTNDDIFANVTLYNAGDLSPSQTYEAIFNVSSNTATTYWLRASCNSTTASTANGNAEALLVNAPSLASASSFSGPATINERFGETTTFYGNCTASGPVNGINIIVQNSTDDVAFSNTPTIGASGVKTNITSYLIGSLEDTSSSDYSFEITGYTNDTYYLRTACNATDASTANSASSALAVNTCNRACPTLTGETVTGTVEYCDSICTMTGELEVANGGNLTLRNMTLEMNVATDGEFGLEVKPGGALYVIEGSNITGYDATDNYYFNVTEATDLEIINSYISDVGWSWLGPFGSYDDPKEGSPGLRIISTPSFNLTNNIIQDNFDGIWIDFGSNNGWLYNNTIKDSVAIGFVLKNTTGLTLKYNNITNSGYDDVYMRDTPLTGNPNPYNHSIDTTNYVTNGKWYYYFNANNQVLNGSEGWGTDGGKFHFTYSNNLTVENITLMNAGDQLINGYFLVNSTIKDVTVNCGFMQLTIDGGNRRATGIQIENNITNLIIDNANVTGCGNAIEIAGEWQGTGLGSYETGSSNNLTIQNSYIYNVSRTGIELYRMQNITIWNNVFKLCVLSLGTDCWLIHLANAANYNTVTENYFYGDNADGTISGGDYGKSVDTFYSNYSIIKNNYINGSGYGLHIDCSYNQTVVNNTFEGNDDAIGLWASWNNTIISNQIVNNFEDGFDFRADNNAYCSSGDGNLPSVQFNTVTRNNITNNGVDGNGYGFQTTGTLDSTIARNNYIYDNWIEGNPTGDVNDVLDDSTYKNYFNTSYDCGSTSIVGGCVGGNYYSDNTAAEDTDGDGIADTSYEIPPTGESPSTLRTYDYLPLNKSSAGSMLSADGAYTSSSSIFEQQSIDFQANCTCSGVGDCAGVDLVIQNSTDDSTYSDTPIDSNGDVYTNVTLYNAGTITNGNTYERVFNITANNNDTYYFRAQCNSTSTVATSYTSTGQALTVSNHLTSSASSLTSSSVYVSQEYTELYGNCTADGSATGVNIIAQNSSDGSTWSNTPTTVSDIYVNLSSYDIGSLSSSTSSDYSFNYTTTSAGTYYTRLQCNATNSESVNSASNTLTATAPGVLSSDGNFTASLFTIAEGDSIVYNGNCTCTSAVACSGVNLILQNSSNQATWSNTPVDTAGPIYSNVTSYLNGTLGASDTYEHQFEVTGNVNNTYYFRAQCNLTNAYITTYNSGSGALSVVNEPQFSVYREQSVGADASTNINVRFVVWNNDTSEASATAVNITDYFPSGWTVASKPAGATTTANSITIPLWDMPSDNLTTINYTITSGSANSYQFGGNITYWFSGLSKILDIFNDPFSFTVDTSNIYFDSELDLDNSDSAVQRIISNGTDYTARIDVENIGNVDATGTTYFEWKYNNNSFTVDSISAGCGSSAIVDKDTVKAVTCNWGTFTSGEKKTFTFKINTTDPTANTIEYLSQANVSATVS